MSKTRVKIGRNKNTHPGTLVRKCRGVGCGVRFRTRVTTPSEGPQDICDACVQAAEQRHAALDRIKQRVGNRAGGH